MRDKVVRELIEILTIFALPLAGEKVGAARPTNWAGDEGIFEKHALFCQLVDIWRFCDRMPRHAQ